VPGLSKAVNAAVPKLMPRDALKAAAAAVGAAYDESRYPPLGRSRGPEQRQYFSMGAAFNTDIPVRLIYYPVSRTSVRLVWEVFAGKAGQPYNYQVFVDAQDGKILVRLVVQSIETPTWEAANSQSVIRAEIRTVGNAEASPTLARVVDWGTLYDTGAPYNDVAETPALAAGQSATLTFRLRNWVLRPQSVLGVTADYKHMLVECFEENNTKELR